MKTELSLSHVPPQATEIEQSILASCLLGQTEEATELLKPEDFYRSAHQKIFTAICDLVHKKVEADLPSTAETLRSAGHLEEIGGASYLAHLVDEAPVPSNIPHYAKILKDKSILRKLIDHTSKIAQAAYGAQGDALSIIDDAQKRILGIEYQSNNETTVCYRDLSVEAADRYEELSRRKNHISGIPSGFYILDHLTCGFQKSDLVILAGRPSQGKTALAANIANNLGRQGIPSAFFSLEMSQQQLFDRSAASLSKVNSQKFRSGKFDQSDWQAITDTLGKLYQLPIYIDDSAALHYHEIQRRARKLKKNYGIKCAFIDHLQLIRGDNSSSRDREIGSITAGLKAMAKELDIPVILLSQLNRKLEDRPNPCRRPRLSDLRDSGNIEQDADIVAFLYRPEVYGDQEDFPGHAELIVTKHRNGPTGTIKLLWHEKTTTFRNLETHGNSHR